MPPVVLQMPAPFAAQLLGAGMARRVVSGVVLHFAVAMWIYFIAPRARGLKRSKLF